MVINSVSIDRKAVPPTVEFSDTFNVANLFLDKHIIEGRKKKIALLTESATVTYGELIEKVNRCGNALGKLGLHAGERVLLVVKDCPEFFYIFWGAIKRAIIPVPVNTMLGQDDYEYLIQDSECELVLYSEEYADIVERAVEGSRRTPQSCNVDLEDGRFLSLMEDSPGTLPLVVTSAVDDCFWLYSSGSTGRPKAAVHRHQDMVMTSLLYGEGILHVSEKDCCFSAAKLFFAYGLGNSMCFPLWCGATTILAHQRPTPALTLGLIERLKPTLYFGVPTLYAAQLQQIEGEARDLSSLRACVSAGEALPPEVFRRWEQHTGLQILDGIGSTELLHIFISNRPENYKPGTSGQVVPGYDAKIVDESGVPVNEGEIGQLLVSGGSAASHYWNQPERTAQTMQGGWVRTGDTYFQDSEGYFHYCGRADDMLKVSGQWVSPAEVEAVLFEHDAVLEAAIIGNMDEHGLLKPKAFVVLKEDYSGSTALAAELGEFVKDRLLPHKYPRWVEFVPDLPKTATGKIQRFKLRSG